jgi:hypothetical protein
MGILNRLSKPRELRVSRLPAGSFTVDSLGQVLISTVPHDYPQPLLAEIGRCVIDTFRSAREVNLPLTEVVVHYSALKMTARELRGGAIVFLTPRSMRPGSTSSLFV